MPNISKGLGVLRQKVISKNPIVANNRAINTPVKEAVDESSTRKGASSANRMVANCAKSALPSKGDDDALFGLDLCEKLEFYLRLAKIVKELDNDSLASTLMEHWITGKGQKKTIPNKKIKYHRRILEEIEVYREIYLSKRKTNWSTGNNKIAGVVPRLENGIWDGTSDLSMEYVGQYFDIVTTLEFYRILAKGLTGNDLTEEEKIDLDLFNSLHTTNLYSEVIVSGNRVAIDKVEIVFKKWSNYVGDNYNWNKKRHLTLPNPDFNNKYRVQNPVRPNSKEVKIYHHHAVELEENGLAHSFDFQTEPWDVNVPGDIVTF